MRKRAGKKVFIVSSIKSEVENDVVGGEGGKGGIVSGLSCFAFVERTQPLWQLAAGLLPCFHTFPHTSEGFSQSSQLRH